MKKIRFSKVIAALISALMLLTFLASCATSMGEPLMTLENKTITVNMYRLWLSRVKGGYGGGNNGIWDEVSADGRTYNEIFTGFVKQNAMTFLSA